MSGSIKGPLIGVCTTFTDLAMGGGGGGGGASAHPPLAEI